MKESDIEVIKRVGRENTARARQALERQTRATPAERHARVKRLRSSDDVHKAFSELRYADFSEVVAAAVLAGNFSDQDASHALHLRQWVRCGGAERTSFPEWMVSEGLEHFSKLNTEWLASGLTRTSFNEWLAAQTLPSDDDLGADARDPWTDLSRIFDGSDAELLGAYLSTVYQTVYRERDQPNILAYYASFVLGVAVTIRETAGIDIGTLIFMVEPPPLLPSHPLVKLSQILDPVIKETMEFFGKAKKDDPRRLDAMAMIHASLLWRGYLSALNTYPESWGADSVASLSALRILTTADSARVIDFLRNEGYAVRGTFTEAVRKAVRESDWPPRGYLDLYRKHGGILEQKCRALFGAFY
jgi:hypothetical protein